MPAASNLKVYTEDGTTLVSTITFTGVVPGTRSSAQTFRLANDDSDGEVEPATDPYLVARQRDPTTDEPVLRGLRAVDERWLEFELIGESSAGVDQMATGIQPVGRGRVLRTVTLPSGGWTKFRAYYHPPMSAPEGSITFTVAADANGPAVAVEQGHSESSRDGVLSGVGDGSVTELVVGGVITATGTPDEFTNWPDVAWLHEGIPQVLLAHAEEQTNLDGSAVALGADQGYWVRWSLGAGASVTQTKSDLFDLVDQDPADIPAVPTGEIDCGYALVTDALAIGAADITSRLNAGRFSLTPTSLNLFVGRGRARVDNAIITRQTQGMLALPGSEADVQVWLTPGGERTYTTDGSRPDPRAYLLAHGPTAVSSIDLTAWETYVEPIGPEPVPVVLTWSGTLVNGAKARGVYPLNRPGYLRVPRGMVWRYHDPGTGNTAGEFRLDVTVDTVDAFPSAGTTDRRPLLDYNDSPALDTDALPEVLPVAPWAIIEATIDEVVAYDGTAPSGATLVVLVDPT